MLRVETRGHAGDTSIVCLHGVLDVTTAPQMRQALSRLLTEGKPNLILDLNGVESMDATGLGALVGELRLASSAGGDLNLVCGRPEIIRAFEMTNLDRLFQIYHSQADALASR